MNKFAFIIHPINLDDFTRKFKWMGKVPDSLLKKFTKKLPPFKVSHITGIKSITGKEIEGYFIACPLTSEQILELPTNYVLDKIIKAGKKAEEIGAQVLGLGSFTSVVGDKGITVANTLDIPVTTGNSYTVVTAVQGTKAAAEKMGLEFPGERVTVIGATGSIGRAVSLILSQDIYNLQIVSRSEEKLKFLEKELENKYPALDITLTTNIARAIKQSRIIISASGAVNALIDPYDLLPGTVICDVARPRDVAHQVKEVRDDVLVIDGGIVKVPGSVDFNFNFGCPPQMAFACMAETMILTLEGMFFDYSLGSKIEISKVSAMKKLAEKHGFKLAGLRSFESQLTDDKITQIRNKAEGELTVSP